MFACAILGGLHWNGVVAMLGALRDLAKEDALQLFEVFVQRTHGLDVAQWLSRNLESVES